MATRLALVVSISINILIAILFLRGCNSPCPEAVVTKHWTDTVYADAKTVQPTIYESVPKPVRIHPQSPKGALKENVIQKSSITFTSLATDNLEPANYTCADSVFYIDTIDEPNKYRAILEEIVCNNLIHYRNLKVFNLQPRIIEHEEKTIPAKEKVCVYAGVFAGIQASYTDRKLSVFNVGPEIMITEPHGLMVGYGFDARNNGHQLQLLYKIKLKK